MLFQVDLKVDGQKVGYWYTIGYDNGRWLEQAKFEGFCTQIGGQAGVAGDAYQTTYQRFRFARADPSQDAGPEVRVGVCSWGGAQCAEFRSALRPGGVMGSARIKPSLTAAR
jgi:hypothetical protein